MFVRQLFILTFGCILAAGGAVQANESLSHEEANSDLVRVSLLQEGHCMAILPPVIPRDDPTDVFMILMRETGWKYL